MYACTSVCVDGRMEGWIEVCLRDSMLAYACMCRGLQESKRVRYRMLYVLSHYPFSIRAPELCASRLDGTRRIQQELLQVAVRGRMQGEGK